MYRERLLFARVCIEVSSAEELKDSIKIVDDAGNTFIQQVQYEWKPPRCCCCLVFGHSSASCLPQQTISPDDSPPQAPPGRTCPREGSGIGNPQTTEAPPPVVGGGNAVVSGSVSDDRTLPAGLPHAQPSTGQRPAVAAVNQPSDPMTVTRFTFPRKRRMARRVRPSDVPSSSKSVTAPTELSVLNRFGLLDPPPLPSVCPSLMPPSVDSHSETRASTLSDPPSSTLPTEPEPLLAHLDLNPSLKPSTNLAQAEINLRPDSRLSLSSQKSLRTPPPMLASRLITHPTTPYAVPSSGTSSLLDRYSAAKSLAARSVAPSKFSIINSPHPLIPSPSNPPPPSTCPEAPSPPPPLPDIHDPPNSHLRPPLLPPSLGAQTELGPEGSDYEENVSNPCEDPMYLAKLQLLDPSSSEDDRNLEEIHSLRTRFHCDDNSPPKLFRKTPRKL